MEDFEKAIKEQLRLRQSHIRESFLETDEILGIEKGKKAQVGEVRTWKGVKHQKQGDGTWKPVTGAKKEGEKKLNVSGLGDYVDMAKKYDRQSFVNNIGPKYMEEPDIAKFKRMGAKNMNQAFGMIWDHANKSKKEGEKLKEEGVKKEKEGKQFKIGEEVGVRVGSSAWAAKFEGMTTTPGGEKRYKVRGIEVGGDLKRRDVKEEDIDRNYEFGKSLENDIERN